MTAKECLKGLGATKKFYIKSRFAVCSGASFNQTWLVNNRPSGESQIVFLAVGTIAKGSRTMNVYHHYQFKSVGRTGAPGMILTPKVTLPQTWPASARISQGGDLPAGQSWATLAAQPDPGFSHNLTGKSGTGSGPDDALFTVFQPELSLKVTGGWTMTGALKGAPFFLAPRWDKAKYLAGSRADGGAAFSYAVSMPFSTKAGAKERAAAQHIKDAYTKPTTTEPKNTKKDIPGRTAKEPLTRLYHDEKRRKANRDEAVKACKAKWGAGYSEGETKQCDEFPFSTTYEGAAQALKKYDPQGKAPKKNFSARPIPNDDNEAGGRIMSGFYTKNRIIDGADDGFLIKVS
ncbi:NucA/NucB deoxyribonuclease domain-containing protein [Streptomyces sp. NPDC054855]